MEISKDIGAEVIERLEEINLSIQKLKKEAEDYEMNFPKFPSTIGEKMNSQLHLFLETSLHKSLKEEARLRHLSMGDYCRRRLRGIY